jgi:hypothetical protein
MLSKMHIQSTSRIPVLPEKGQVSAHTSRVRSQPTCQIFHKNNFPRRSCLVSLRRPASMLICSAAATVEYGQLTDIGVPLDTYIVLVSY